MSTERRNRKNIHRGFEKENSYQIPTKNFLTFWHPFDIDSKLKWRPYMSRSVRTSKRYEDKGYETLTLREIVRILKKESSERNEILTRDELGDLTLRDIVEVAREYAESERREWRI
jgi:hypothetical protein